MENDETSLGTVPLASTGGDWGTFIVAGCCPRACWVRMATKKLQGIMVNSVAVEIRWCTCAAGSIILWISVNLYT